MTIADALDQALWDYDADGQLQRPAPAVTAVQHAAFTAAAQRATFALASRPTDRYTVDTRLPEEQ